MTYQNYLDLTGTDLHHLESCYFRVGTQIGARHLKDLGTPTRTKAQRADHDLQVEAWGLTLFAVSYEKHIAATSHGSAHDVYGDHLAYGYECKHLHVLRHNKYLVDDDWTIQAYLSMLAAWEDWDPLVQAMYQHERTCPKMDLDDLLSDDYNPTHSDGRLRYPRQTA